MRHFAVGICVGLEHAAIVHKIVDAAKPRIADIDNGFNDLDVSMGWDGDSVEDHNFPFLGVVVFMN